MKKDLQINMLRPKHIAPLSTMVAPPLRFYLAKTYSPSQNNVLPGRNIFEHACITGEVAKALIDLYPSILREACFPSGCPFAVSTHDVGKITPTFQKLLYGAIGDMPPELENTPDPALEKQRGGHAGVGQTTLAACNAGKYLPEIVGKHHGV